MPPSAAIGGANGALAAGPPPPSPWPWVGAAKPGVACPAAATNATTVALAIRIRRSSWCSLLLLGWVARPVVGSGSCFSPAGSSSVPRWPVWASTGSSVVLLPLTGPLGGRTVRNMGIGVLGPVVSDGDVAFGRRDRAVLTALAIRVGQPVSEDQLTEAVWGEQPPRSAHKSLQGCVFRIRQALGNDVIRTSPQGYVLTLPADDVDARRFERLVGRGRELLALGEPERAAYLLGEALALWRGTPFQDLELSDLAGIEGERLEELRQEAEELRVEASLRTGGTSRCSRRPRPWSRRRPCASAAGSCWRWPSTRQAGRPRRCGPSTASSGCSPSSWDRPRSGARRIGGGDPPAGRLTACRRTGADDGCLPLPRAAAVRPRRPRGLLRPRRRRPRLPGHPARARGGLRRRSLRQREVLACAGGHRRRTAAPGSRGSPSSPLGTTRRRRSPPSRVPPNARCWSWTSARRSSRCARTSPPVRRSSPGWSAGPSTGASSSRCGPTGSRRFGVPRLRPPPGAQPVPPRRDDRGRACAPPSRRPPGSPDC